MSGNSKSEKVDLYLDRARKWQDEMGQLRSIILGCGLTEDLKWGKPCYSYKDSNIVIIQGFKEYLAVLFFKGFLLKDPDGILVKTGPNTRVGRQIRFKNSKEISKLKSSFKSYILHAMEVEKSGVKIERGESMNPELVEELRKKLKTFPELKAAFEALTPGRQKAYNFYFSGAKQSATRESRIEKCMKHILQGKGLNDR